MEKDWNGIIIKINEKEFKEHELPDQLWFLLLGQKKACEDIKVIQDRLINVDEKGCTYGKISYRNLFKLLYVLLGMIGALIIKSIV